MIAQSPRNRMRRRGYGLAEVAMAVLLLMATMTFTVKALGLAAAERMSADHCLCATFAVSNVLERATALPYGEATEVKIRSLAEDEHVERALPRPEWQVDVRDDPAGTIAGKRITVRLRWKQRSDYWEAPVRLSAWVFQAPKGGRP